MTTNHTTATRLYKPALLSAGRPKNFQICASLKRLNRKKTGCTLLLQLSDFRVQFLALEVSDFVLFCSHAQSLLQVADLFLQVTFCRLPIRLQEKKRRFKFSFMGKMEHILQEDGEMYGKGDAMCGANENTESPVSPSQTTLSLGSSVFFVMEMPYYEEARLIATIAHPV